MNDDTEQGARPVNDIKERIDEMSQKGPRPRLITIFTQDNGDDTFQLIYAFHHENRYTEVRYVVKGSDELESLSSYYAGAVNMEREVIDMMGLRFKGIEGGLLLEPGKGIVTPLRKSPREAPVAGPTDPPIESPQEVSR
jgi:Ni,Fe-hydrogenase III component G